MRLLYLSDCFTKSAFQSTHPLRGATNFPFSLSVIAGVSIHAPPARCDRLRKNFIILLTVSIHAPPARCDLILPSLLAPKKCFNPRTPCEVRLKLFIINYLLLLVSIHAPPARCDMVGTDDIFCTPVVSIHAPPARCDKNTLNRSFPIWVSIHAPPARCDLIECNEVDRVNCFNPRTPCEVRHQREYGKKYRAAFQSTHPLRGATQEHFLSIPSNMFQSTHPLRGATPLPHRLLHEVRVSIHAPPARCDIVGFIQFVYIKVSIHAPPARCDHHHAPRQG